MIIFTYADNEQNKSQIEKKSCFNYCMWELWKFLQFVLSTLTRNMIVSVERPKRRANMFGISLMLGGILDSVKKFS